MEFSRRRRRSWDAGNSGRCWSRSPGCSRGGRRSGYRRGSSSAATSTAGTRRPSRRSWPVTGRWSWASAGVSSPTGSDAEDAFQATFVILARKGRTLGEDDPVGRWLYGVARRVALRARGSADRRRRLERSAPPAEAAPAEDPSRLELTSIIDREVAGLPERFRAPVVLCYLEGLTHEEAAQRLGWPLGSVKGRLSRARDLLKGRLSRRGLAPSGMIALARGARVAVPKPLMEVTMRVAMASRSGGMVPPTVASLAAGSLTTMLMNKLKAAVVVALLLGTGAAVMAYQFGGMGTVSGTQVKVSGPQVKPAPSEPARANQPGPSIKAGSRGRVDRRLARPHQPARPRPQDQGDPGGAGAAAHHEIHVRHASRRCQEVHPGGDQGEPGLPGGIPIYVDPIGLQDSDKTMASTVVIDLDGIPLKTTLRLLLKQLSLEYVVKDGLMTITSGVEDQQTTPFRVMQEKAKRGELTRLQYQQLIEALKLKRQVEELTAAQPTPTKGGGFQ